MQNKKNIFFAAVTKPLLGELLDFDRLYSFPKEPEPSHGRHVVIDSGAFGLMMQKRHFNESLIQKLAKFHKEKCKEESFILVAPDHPGNPYASVENFFKYKNISDLNVRPCFQFKGGYFNVKEFLFQYDKYKKHCSFDFVFIADKNAEKPVGIDEKKLLAENFFMRKYLPSECFIHYFSCGKSLTHVRMMCSMHNVSFDTTNWQYDAKSRQGTETLYKVDWSGNYVEDCKAILKKIKSVTDGNFTC